MKLIGAGLPRTATTTQMIALEMLGLPCYHMRDMMADLSKSVPQWRQAFEGNGPWDELFEGKESIVDWPGSYHWRELMDVYPDAKVLLSVRSAESWVESMHNTIAAIWFGDNLMHHLAQAQYQIDPVYAAWLDLLNDMWVKADIMVAQRRRPRRRWPPAWSAGTRRSSTPCPPSACWSGTPRTAGSRSASSSSVDVPERAAAARQRHREVPEEPDHGSRHRGDQRVVGAREAGAWSRR